jgi:hypothetical protein
MMKTPAPEMFRSGRQFAARTWPGSAAPLVVISQAAISARPSPPCLKIFSPVFRPVSSIRNTQWLWLPQSTLAYHCFRSLMDTLPLQGRAAVVEPPQPSPIPVLALEARMRIRRGLPTGRRSRPIHRGTCPPQVFKTPGNNGRSRWTGSVREGYTI